MESGDLSVPCGERGIVRNKKKYGESVIIINIQITDKSGGEEGCLFTCKKSCLRGVCLCNRRK